MKITYSLITLVLLAGCSTPYDLRKTKPRISYSTTRPPEEVVKCISKKWKAHLNPVLEEKTDNGWLIRYNDVMPNATVMIVTVEGSAPDVQVNYYHRTNRIKLHRVEEEVESCK